MSKTPLPRRLSRTTLLVVEHASACAHLAPSCGRRGGCGRLGGVRVARGDVRVCDVRLVVQDTRLLAPLATPPMTMTWMTVLGLLPLAARALGTGKEHTRRVAAMRDRRLGMNRSLG